MIVGLFNASNLFNTRPSQTPQSREVLSHSLLKAKPLRLLSLFSLFLPEAGAAVSAVAVFVAVVPILAFLVALRSSSGPDSSVPGDFLLFSPVLSVLSFFLSCLLGPAPSAGGCRSYLLTYLSLYYRPLRCRCRWQEGHGLSSPSVPADMEIC